MNRLKQLFVGEKQEEGILNIYFTAGFPKLEQTKEIIVALEQSGTDIVELGIPFSDPLADGPTIQKSSELALSNGMTINKLFEQLEGMRKEITIPVILMGYLNPILQYGLNQFLDKAAEVGIDGFIFPDVPTIEFEREWQANLEKRNLTFSFLVTPQTNEHRIRYLDSLSTGFLYAVSSSSTTGKEKQGNHKLEMSEYLRKLKSMELKNPILAGFGISSREDYIRVNREVDGAIIGSAFIKHLTNYGASSKNIETFVNSIKKG